MPAFNRAAAGGNRYAFMWFKTSDGFATGSTPTAPATGAAGSGVINIRGIKTASPAVPEPDALQITGDDDLIGELEFPSLETRRFTIEYSVEDLQVLSTLLNITLKTWGEARVALLDIVNPPTYNVGFIFQSRAIQQDTASLGAAGWSGTIVPQATATPLGRAAFEERGAAVFRMSITPQIAGYDPLGLTINPANYNTTGARLQPFTAENPVALHTARGNGTVTTFNLLYAPISAAKVAATVNRTNATVTAVSTTNKTATLSTAPAADAVVTFVYEFEG